MRRRVKKIDRRRRLHIQKIISDEVGRGYFARNHIVETPRGKDHTHYIGFLTDLQNMSAAKKQKTISLPKTLGAILDEQNSEGVRPIIDAYSPSKFQCRVKCDCDPDMVETNKLYWYEAKNNGDMVYLHSTYVQIKIPKSKATYTIAKAISDYIESTHVIDYKELQKVKWVENFQEKGFILFFPIQTQLNVPLTQSDWVNIEKPKLYRDVWTKLKHLFDNSFIRNHKLMLVDVIPSADKMSDKEEVIVTFVAKNRIRLSKSQSVYTLTLIQW